MSVHSKCGNNITRSIIDDACDESEAICDMCGNNKDLGKCDKCKIIEM